NLNFAQADQAAKGVESVKALIALAQTFAPQIAKSLDYQLVENPNPPHGLIRIFPQIMTGLKNASIEAQGTELTIKLTVDSDRNTIAAAVPDSVTSLGNRAVSTFEDVGGSGDSPPRRVPAA